MIRRLVIVESPTKARTLKRFLGPEYLVESSVGHVRDLPANAAEVPAKYKKEPWARLGVNVEDDFKPLYVVSPEKKKTISELKKALKEVDELLLATDEDREGEAISWHLVELLKPTVPVLRMVFHEITRPAIMHASENTREINSDLVGAQETRRIIDRLYGYEVSPILWKKIAPRLSAGRVQSVAIKMLVDREWARIRFKPADFWDLTATFRTDAGKLFPARLQTVDGKRVAGGKDFDPDTGELKRKNLAWLDTVAANQLRDSLAGVAFRILSVEEKPFTRTPAPAFTTSTLQQEGNRKLRFDAKRTMRAAQRLYESGYITYMRTDSVHLSNDAIRITREAIKEKYGEEYLPEKPRFYKTKVKNAQEAHEAIRPAGSRIASVGEVRQKLGGDEAKVYELIWKRTMACQMKEAKGRRMTVQVVGESDGREVVFVANGNTIDFPGFLRSYVEGRDDPEAALSERETILPPVRQGEAVSSEMVVAEGHTTAPPARLTEATLVKALEESGIGRPSTYASIIDTILRREYSFKKGMSLVPTFTAFSVVSLMKQHFTKLIDEGFTAEMEDRLDMISRGEFGTLEYLNEFYYGNHQPGLKPTLEQKVEDIDAREVCTITLGEAWVERGMAVRVGRYGPYLAKGELTAPIPESALPDELTVEAAEALLAAGQEAEKPIGIHPDTGEPVYAKTGRFGPYVQLGDPDPDKKKKKPKMVSLLKGMERETVTLEQAVQLLSLPRVLGTDEKGVDVVAYLGRYGPYLKRGEDTRSLEAQDDLLTIGIERALALLAQPKRGGRRTASAEPLKVFPKVEALGGVDVKLLDGRYGPYLTDGTVNASLPKSFSEPLEITIEQVVDFIEKKRAAGPAKKKRRTTTKKATSKKKPASKKKKTASKKKAATKKKTTNGNSPD